MKNSNLDLPDSKAELTEIVLSNIKEIERLSEEIRLLRQALFAPKSEKLPVGDSPQLLLFDMPENLPVEEEEQVEKIVVPEHTRKKKDVSYYLTICHGLMWFMIYQKRKKSAPVAVG